MSELAPRRTPPLWARLLKRPFPRSLFGRTLLIVVTPTLLALCVATFVFFDRHWDTVTRRLTHAAAGDIAFVIQAMRQAPTSNARAEVVRLADEKMDLYVSFSKGENLKVAESKIETPLRSLLRQALEMRLGLPFSISMRHAPSMIAIQVGEADGVYTILLPERRIYTPTTEVFIGWMVGSSVLLSAIALLFMRNQIRPIRRLAEAAEAIGKGQEVPWYNPEGAVEVRQAGTALLLMSDRLRRQVTQRMAMLSGVSHDLRTPLTRMKLQLALMPPSQETEEFTADIAEMENMLEAYLAFARGEEAEPAVEVDIALLIEEIVSSARRQGGAIEVVAPAEGAFVLRRHAIKRCLGNLVGNALRYGKRAQISLLKQEHQLNIFIDDDGPGIAPEKREDVFRPFLRLDESRNPVTGGVGLGLTIARDIARFHGGDIVLEDSPLGGLRARVWLPV